MEAVDSGADGDFFELNHRHLCLMVAAIVEAVEALN